VFDYNCEDERPMVLIASGKTSQVERRQAEALRLIIQCTVTLEHNGEIKSQEMNQSA
jgi:hypothetical protein